MFGREVQKHRDKLEANDSGDIRSRLQVEFTVDHKLLPENRQRNS